MKGVDNRENNISMRFLRKYYIIFLCLNVFLPKINLGFGSFYSFEIVNICIFLLLLTRHKLFFKSIVVQTYLLFLSLTFISFFLGVLVFQFFDAISFVRLAKFSLFTLYLILPYYIYNDISTKDLYRIVNSQFIFFLFAGAYVAFNMITMPKSIHSYIWEYDNRYRLLGFTGYSLSFDGSIKMIGSTSVSMGVFIALIFLIQLSLYKFKKDKVTLVKLLVLLCLEMLTYSRAGILVMSTGIIYYFSLNFKHLNLRWLIFGLILLVTASATNLAREFSSFGTLSKVFEVSVEDDASVQIRLDMLKKGLNYVMEHPYVLFIGSGYGEAYTQKTIGYPHLEGLVPTTVFTSGVLAAGVLILHFVFLWRETKSAAGVNNSYQPFAYGLMLFIPGWFLSAVTAGNTFQTDYYFPIIYFIFFSCYFKMRKPNIDDQQQSPFLQAFAK